MLKETNIISKLHLSTKRNYIERMLNKKVECMGEAKKYSKNYWDGPRKFGYGGYKYIPGRWTAVAKKLISKYELNNKSKILDVGCGKGFLLKEIQKILPGITIYGFDISRYAIKQIDKKIKKRIIFHQAQKKFPYRSNYFDLVISINTLHNLKNYDLDVSLKEISRVSKKVYLCVESYRDNKELFNLQCWALTCETFLSKNEWIWLYSKYKFKGLYEFIYFN